jgi:hypothetical protein
MRPCPKTPNLDEAQLKNPNFNEASLKNPNLNEASLNLMEKFHKCGLFWFPENFWFGFKVLVWFWFGFFWFWFGFSLTQTKTNQTKPQLTNNQTNVPSPIGDYKD